MHFKLISSQRESTKLLKQWVEGEWRLHLFNGAFARSPPLHASQSRTPLQHASRNWTSAEKHGSVLIGAWAHCSCTKCIAESKPVQSKTFNSGATWNYNNDSVLRSKSPILATACTTLRENIKWDEELFVLYWAKNIIIDNVCIWFWFTEIFWRGSGMRNKPTYKEFQNVNKIHSLTLQYTVKYIFIQPSKSWIAKSCL